jgi:hypothetical protein
MMAPFLLVAIAAVAHMGEAPIPCALTDDVAGVSGKEASKNRVLLFDAH